MRLPLRIWAGLYGLAFHAVVVAVVAWTAARNQADIPASFWSSAIPAFLVAAFAVYVFVVGPYLPKRPTTKGAVFWDSGIGMLAEVAVLALTSILLAVAGPVPEGGGAGAYLAAVANRTLFGFLYALGSFFLQVLVVGNAAGLVGFVIMKRVNDRAARAAPPA